MNVKHVTRAVAPAIIALISLSIGAAARAEMLDKMATFNGTTVEYKVALPAGFDPAKTYPAALAFPPGGQGMDMVDAMMNSIWQAQAEQRGYIVIEPAAPNGEYFYSGGARIFPAFITKLLGDYKVRDNKFNVAGVSNGGLSAFFIAAKYPQYFLSVTGFPGFLDDASPQQIATLGKMCVHMFAGELDSSWANEEKEQAAKFQAAGFPVTFVVEKGQPHFMQTLTGAGAARLFDQFDQARQGHCAK